MSTFLEWSGAAFGVLGSFLLATHGRWSRYGWIVYLAANITMGAFASTIGAHGLLAQQLGFTATTLLGLHRAGWLGHRRRATWTCPLCARRWVVSDYACEARDSRIRAMGRD